MTNVARYYYPSPTLHHHPMNGRIQIGNLIWDATKPEDCSIRGAAPPPPLHDEKTEDVRDIIEYGPEFKGASAPAPAPASGGGDSSTTLTSDGSAVESTDAGTDNAAPASKPRVLHPTIISCQRTVELTTATLRASKFDVWAKLYSIGSSSVVLEWTEKHDAIYNYEKAVTIEFYPDEDYIDSCVALEPINRILTRSKYKKPLYLVTGIKAAIGIRGETGDEATRNLSASAEGDTTAATQGAADAKAGAKAEKKKEKKLGQSFEESSDFVFAFRLMKITVNPKTMEAMAADMTKRALLSKDGSVANLPYQVGDFKNVLPEDLDLVGTDGSNEEGKDV